MVKDMLQLMKPELMMVVILFIVLLLKLREKELGNDVIMGIVNALLLAHTTAGFFYPGEGSLFGQMYHTSPLLAFEKNVLSAGTLVISLLSTPWLKQHRHVPEFYVLLLSTLLGMFFMISANNLLMFYTGLELSTLPLAALVNFDLEKRTSAEAAMKFIMSSAFSSGLLLFGISLLYGTTGTLDFSGITAQLHGDPLQLFAFILLLTGFAFKISAVPFHLWTADVYEGAPVAVTAYLSVISKGALLFVFTTTLYTVFKPFSSSWYNLLFLLSVLTMLVGNLFALRQRQVKRFLAFSSVAQVGFILIGISGQSSAGSISLIYFVLIYIFSNLGAFGVVGAISAATGKEKVQDYNGLYKTNPVLTWVLTISLFSLAGIPPTAGFFGKFFLLMAGAGKGNYLLITIAALNMIISLYYYLKIIKAMFMDPQDEPMPKVNPGFYPGLGMVICIVGILVAGITSGTYGYVYSLVTGK